MPRNHALAPSARGRNRVTNKSRLRVIYGNINADPLAFDEDAEKARVVSTAGVDAEDANEHHLQAVLSASTRGNASKGEKPPAAHIPTPDSTGIVEEYERWYAPERWREPASYFKTSETIEETLAASLAHGFTYLMDERDKEWLDKNNEEARGEGTSAQGALSTSGAATRLSQRKGKEPDVSQPVAISEDVFELVMGLFEKVTHDRARFLHHGIEQGAPFPPFSDYEDAFSMPLPPDAFSAFAVPSWVPKPPILVRIASAIYPYWKERRLERNGHRIIPTLNYDESDIKNESYLCFRQREVKNMRKTRASQASSSEKLVRLQQELASALELAKAVRLREEVKRRSNGQSRAVWDKRADVVSMHRKFPNLVAKEDEELLFDKERVVKKPRPAEQIASAGRLKISKPRDVGAPSSTMTLHKSTVRPKEHAAKIQAQIDQEMAELKERDRHWEDSVDNPYQLPPVEFAARHFQFTPPPEHLMPSLFLSSTILDEEPSPQWRAVRLRRGRGGVLRMDRRILASHSSTHDDDADAGPSRRRRPPAAVDSENDSDPAEVQELARLIGERWRFDADETLPDPEGLDEQDRVLVDEYDPKYLRRSMTVFQERDHDRLTTDATLLVPTADGRVQGIVPFRLGVHPLLRRQAYDAALAAQRAQSVAQSAARAPSVQLSRSSSDFPPQDARQASAGPVPMDVVKEEPETPAMPPPPPHPMPTANPPATPMPNSDSHAVQDLLPVYITPPQPLTTNSTANAGPSSGGGGSAPLKIPLLSGRPAPLLSPQQGRASPFRPAVAAATLALAGQQTSPPRSASQMPNVQH